ncbi:ABC transporter permease [Arthrobacter sp. efr-133-R2A-120]|uniref:ABC transporter permease n=1 Tax=Arthrobacter sp. efr-133-R2A-120 TaxID=3040277 RepID=UPI00254ED607|nr:ABC transporter permease [Arthrobacter sp. efr-133-R2A-120]
MSTEVATPTPQKQNLRREWTPAALRKAGALPALVVVLILGSALSPFFMTIDNIRNVLGLASIIGLLAVGQGFVIIAGGAGIDLSIGATLALAAIVGAKMAPYGPVGVILGALFTGLFVGTINGLGIAFGRLQPFIITLGTMTIATGAAFFLSGSNPIRLRGDNALKWLSTEVFGIPVPVIVFVLTVAIAQIVLSKTVFGRQIYVLGGNEEAAHFAGIPVVRHRMTVYMISGLCAGMGALVLMSRLQTADPAYGHGYELAAIAAVVVGGAPLTGGVGTIRGVAVGVLIIQFITNILDLLNVNPYIQAMVQGLILIAVVALNRRGSATSVQALKRSVPLICGLALGAILLFGLQH